MATKINGRLVTTTIIDTVSFSWVMGIVAGDMDTAGDYCVHLNIDFVDGTTQTIYPKGSIEYYKDDTKPNLSGLVTFSDATEMSGMIVTLTMVDAIIEKNLEVLEVCS